MEGSWRKRFGEDISKLVLRGNRLKCDCTLKHMLADEVTIDLNMLSTFMEDIIMSNFNSTLIITMKLSCSRTINTKIM